MTVVFIVGPTAIGKTRTSVKLARRINGEIISADSMQGYRSMHILSQAPTKEEKKAVKHHLVEFLDPKKEYSAALFCDKATQAIKSIIKRGKVPIVAGGSGLYVKTLIDGLFPTPPADMKFRKKMHIFLSKYGAKKLHRKLCKIDPDAAERIHPNDARRIIRALEIEHTTGRTMTELKAETRGIKDIYGIKMFGLTRPREEMYAGIEARIDDMFEENVLGEVKRLKKRKMSKTAKAVLGYKEILGFLKGEYDLEGAKDLMKLNTRRFAKRQLTWFGADHRIKWFDLSKINDGAVIREIAKEI